MCVSLIPRYPSKIGPASLLFSSNKYASRKTCRWTRKIEIEVEIQFMLERYSIWSLLVPYQQDFRLGKLGKWRHPDWNTKHGDSYDGVSYSCSCPLPFFLGRAYHRSPKISTAADNQDFWPVVDRDDHRM